MVLSSQIKDNGPSFMSLQSEREKLPRTTLEAMNSKM